MSAHGKISLAGFSCNVGATYAGEPVEVVVAAGLVDILHAGVVVATHAQRVREDQADRVPRAPAARRARDATAGVTVTRLADAAGVVSFAGTPYAAGRRWARTAVDVSASPSARPAAARRGVAAVLWHALGRLTVADDQRCHRWRAVAYSVFWPCSTAPSAARSPNPDAAAR